jgi:hypothetical protein
MTLQAYFDASARQSGLFCVAGYAFTKSKVAKFDRDWSKLFGKYGGCHLRELASRNGRFKGIGDAESERLFKGAVEIINRRMSYGVVISCSLPEIDALLPKWIHGFEHAYPVCCHLVMTQLGMFLADNLRTESVDYFFEDGDEYAGVARDFMSRTLDVPVLKTLYRHASHRFVDKTEAIALQAADLLAWEWAKFMDETVKHPKRRTRRSLIALMTKNAQFDSTRYEGHHIEGETLATFCRKVHELGILQLRSQTSRRD